MDYFQNAIAVDIETTVECFQKLRVITTFDKGIVNVVETYRTGERADYINNKLWVGANIAYFDMPILQKNGYEPSGIWDVLLVEQFLSGGNLGSMPSYADLVLKYHGVRLPKDLQKSDWSIELSEEQKEYCANDVIYLLDIAQKQYDCVAKFGMLPFLELFHSTAQCWFRDVTEGFPIDEQKRKELHASCEIEFTKLNIQILSLLPMKLFKASNITGTAFNTFLNKLSPYCANIQPIVKDKSIKIKDAIDNYDFELFREYITATGDFDDNIFITPSSPTFGAKLAQHYGVESDTYNAKFISSFIEDNPSHELTKAFELVLRLRSIAKIKDTYCKPNPSMVDIVDGVSRIKPKFSTTVTSRLTFTPLSQIPRPDEDDDSNMRNKLQAMFLPPKGYITLVADISSEEDVITGLLFRDKFKLKSLQENYDPYLLIASKVFNFKYDNPEQTKTLKKEKKTLRQAMKAAVLARGFGASEWKIDQMLAEICAKNEIKPVVTGKKFITAWTKLYPDIAKAFDIIESSILGALEGLGDYVVGAKQQSRLVSEKLRAKKVLISIGNPFGIQNIQKGHDVANFLRLPQFINFAIQSSGTAVLLIAVQLIKKAYPTITIPATIHDSVIAFVPESGILDAQGNIISLEEIQETFVNCIKLAFWVVFGNSIGVDSGYTKSGLKD